MLASKDSAFKKNSINGYIPINQNDTDNLPKNPEEQSYQSTPTFPIVSEKKEPTKRGRFFSWFSDDPKTIYRSKLPSDSSTINILIRKYDDYCFKESANARGLTLIRKEYNFNNEVPPDFWKKKDDLSIEYSTYLWRDDYQNKLRFKIYNGKKDEGPEFGEITDEHTQELYKAWITAKEILKNNKQELLEIKLRLEIIEKKQELLALNVKEKLCLQINEKEELRLQLKKKQQELLELTKKEQELLALNEKENVALSTNNHDDNNDEEYQQKKVQSEISFLIQKKEEEKALLTLKNELYRQFIIREKVQEFLNPLSIVQSTEFEKRSDKYSVAGVAGFSMLIGLLAFFKTVILAAEPLFSIILSVGSAALLGVRRFLYNAPEEENALNKNINKKAKKHFNGVGFYLSAIGIAASVFAYTYDKAAKYLHYTSIAYFASVLGIAGAAGISIFALICSMPVVLTAYGIGRFFLHMSHAWSHLEILGFDFMRFHFMGTPKYAVEKSPKNKDQTLDTSKVEQEKTLYLESVDDPLYDKKNFTTEAPRKIIQYRLRARYKIEYLSKLDFPNDNEPDVDLLKHKSSLYFWGKDKDNISYSVIYPINPKSAPISNSLYSLFDLSEHPTPIEINTLPKTHQIIIEKLQRQEEQHSLTSTETDLINQLILKKHPNLRNLIKMHLIPEDFDFSKSNKKYLKLSEVIRHHLSSNTHLEQKTIEKIQKKAKKLNITEENCSQLCHYMECTPQINLEDIENFSTELQYQDLVKKIEGKDNLSSTEAKMIRAAAAKNGHPNQLPIEERERFKTQLVKRQIQATGALATAAVGILMIVGILGISAATFGAPIIGAAAIVGVTVLALTVAIAAFTVAREFERFKTAFRRERFGSHMEKITSKFHKLAQEPLREKIAGYIHDPDNSNESPIQKKVRYGCPESGGTKKSEEKTTEERQKEKIVRFKGLNINPDGSDLIIVDNLIFSNPNFYNNLPEQFIHGYILVQDKDKQSLYYYDRAIRVDALKIEEKTSENSTLFNMIISKNHISKPLYTENAKNIARLSYEDLKQMRLAKLPIPDGTSQLFPHMSFGSVKNIWGDRKFAPHSHMGGMNNDLNLIFNPNAPEPDSRKGYYDSDFISTPATEKDFFNRISAFQQSETNKTKEQRTIFLEIITKKILALKAEQYSLNEKINALSTQNTYKFDLMGLRKNNAIEKLKLKIQRLQDSMKAINDVKVQFLNNNDSTKAVNTLDPKIKTELFVSTKNLEKQKQLAMLNGISKEEQINIAIERQATALIFLIGKIQDKRGALLQDMIDLEYDPSKPQSWSIFSASKRIKFNRLLQKEQFHQCLLLLILGEPINTSNYHALFPNHSLNLPSTPATLNTLQDLDDYFWCPENHGIKAEVFKSKKKVSNAHAMMEAVNVYLGHCPPNKEKTQAALDKIPQLIDETCESTHARIRKVEVSLRKSRASFFGSTNSLATTDVDGFKTPPQGSPRRSHNGRSPSTPLIYGSPRNISPSAEENRFSFRPSAFPKIGGSSKA